MHCCKGDQLSLWRIGKLGVSELWDQSKQKFGTGDYVGDIIPNATIQTDHPSLDIWLKYHSCVVFYFLLYFVTPNSCSGSIVVLSSCSDGWRHTVQLICWRWQAQQNATLNLRQRQWSFWHDFDLMKVLKDHSVWKAHYRERKYAEIIINDTKNHFLNAISILPISNHNSFRLLSDKIARVYVCLKNIFIF